jgi:hypothetical protein
MHETTGLPDEPSSGAQIAFGLTVPNGALSPPERAAAEAQATRTPSVITITETLFDQRFSVYLERFSSEGAAAGCRRERRRTRSSR